MASKWCGAGPVKAVGDGNILAARPSSKELVQRSTPSSISSWQTLTATKCLLICCYHLRATSAYLYIYICKLSIKLGVVLGVFEALAFPFPCTVPAPRSPVGPRGTPSSGARAAAFALSALSSPVLTGATRRDKGKFRSQ